MRNAGLSLTEIPEVENHTRPEAPGEDAWLVEQVRAGDAEARQRFVREHYGAIYRYLLSLERQAVRVADVSARSLMAVLAQRIRCRLRRSTVRTTALAMRYLAHDRTSPIRARSRRC